VSTESLGRKISSAPDIKKSTSISIEEATFLAI
ncbi:uncharacterized protein METZ01_LOCUS133267, partial [marine metagenome]